MTVARGTRTDDLVAEASAWGFSCPQVGLDQAVLDLIVSDHARQVVEVFTERHHDELNEQAPGIRSLLIQWLAQDADFETVWNLAFGDAHASLLTDTDVARCAAGLALRLNEAGHAGDWGAQLTRLTRVRFGGWLLPEAHEIHVSARDDSIVVRLKGDAGSSTVAFTRDSDEWQTDDAEALPVIERRGFRFTVSNAESLSPTAAQRLLQADAYEFKREDVATDEAWLSTCEAALDLIAEGAEYYVPWVSIVLRDLVPLQAKQGIFNSGSERFSPGVICVSNQHYRWVLAEMLIHESTHQYLNVITKLGPLDDGTDSTLYFSPFRNKDRPIFFIVVAYHAFANVLLFYRTARAHGLLPEPIGETDAFVNREATLERQLDVIEPALKSTRSLTPLGKALWEPLYGQIHSGDS